MSDFNETWSLVRKRFEDSVADLNQQQLNWRLHPGTLTAGEMILHVAGTEISFISQLKGMELDEFQSRLKAAATDSIVNEKPFPFEPGEITPELCQAALQQGREFTAPVMLNLTDDLRARTVQSVLGPVIDGTGTMARLAYHPAYHQAQVHMIRTAPGFPA